MPASSRTSARRRPATISAARASARLTNERDSRPDTVNRLARGRGGWEASPMHGGAAAPAGDDGFSPAHRAYGFWSSYEGLAATSAMISTHSSTHSLQMDVTGPATSARGQARRAGD